MHPLFTNSSTVPAFLIKLWKLVEDQSTNELIEWNANGSSFIISNSERLAKEILPLYFKHCNIGSFIRQLNMYGFKKVMHYDKVSDSKELEFQHAFFSKDKIELLANIKRKIAASKVESSGEFGFNAKAILSNLSTLKEKQRAMDTTLNKMKKENEILWRELATVRQRHKAQEQVLTKVIQFLVQLIQRSNQNIHVPRKLARMLQDSSMSKENSSQVARIVDVLRNHDSDCFIGPDEGPKKSVSAVIQEVTDSEQDISCSASSDYSLINSPVFKPASKKRSKNATVAFGQHSAAASSLEPISILDNLYNSKTTSDKKSSTTANVEPPKFIAIPIEGDPNKLILVPLENFTKEEISSLSKDSLCNVIALPENTASEPKKKSASKPIYMDYEFRDGLSNNSKGAVYSEESDVNCLSNSECTVSSLGDVSSLSPSNQECDDSLLSDLLQASSISNADVNSELDISETQESPSIEEINIKTEPCLALEHCNNQVAIPSSSSLVKSTNSFYPDFSMLQDPVNSSSIDVKFLEQILSSDDSMNSDFINTKFDESGVNLSFDDIVGNELVQFTPSLIDENKEHDHLNWLDYLSQESYNPEAPDMNNYFCGPKDPDVLIQSNDNISQSIEAVKKERLLTIKQHNAGMSVKKNKRRKVK